MSKNLLFVVIGLLTLSSALADENVLPDAEAEILGVISSLTDAWREGDGEATHDPLKGGFGVAGPQGLPDEV